MSLSDPLLSAYLIRPVNEAAVERVFQSKLGTEDERQDPMPAIVAADDPKLLYIWGGNHRLCMYHRLVEAKKLPANHPVEVRILNGHMFQPGDTATTPIDKGVDPVPWQRLLAEAASHNATTQNVVKVTSLTKAWELYKMILAAGGDAPTAPTAFVKFYKEKFGVNIPGAWKERLRNGKTQYTLEDGWLDTYNFVRLWENSPAVWKGVSQHIAACSVPECTIAVRNLFSGSRKATEDATCLMKDPSWKPQDQYVVKALLNACCAGEPRTVVFGKKAAGGAARAPDDYCKAAEYTKCITASVRTHMHKVCLPHFAIANTNAHFS